VCQDVAVGIATRYVLDGTEDRIPVEGENFRTSTDRPWDPLSPLYNGYRILLKDKAAVALTTHPI